MKCFLSHSSALECLRHFDKEDFSSSRAMPSVANKVSAGELASLDSSRWGFLSYPIHVMAASSGSRCRSDLVRCHVVDVHTPLGFFLRMSEGMYASTPELCFLQMANCLSVAELVMLGLEFCGSYRLDCSVGSGYCLRAPLITKGLLDKRIAKARGFRGSKKATRALRYVLDGSASPMETLLVALLCLPPKLGGYGFPLPRLNLVLDTRKVDSRGFRHRACDLSWPEYGLAVEYDSTTFHSGTKPIERDSKRLVTLGLMNLHVESLTKGQVFDAREFDRVARLLARRMGKRMRTRVPDAMTRRYCLRKELFAYSFESPRFLSEGGKKQ